jgi:ubiquinol-cytochrome c reductase cytochrome b subunit
MMDDPDAPARFGHTPLKGMMPSMLHAPSDRKPDDPPFKPLGQDDMRAVATFLASQGDAETDPPSPARDDDAKKAGEKIVTTRCTTCHLWKGEGDDGDQGLAPELSGYGSPAWVRAQIANPATKATYRDKAVDDAKSKGHMPHFSGDLSAADLELVARWTRARARGIPLGEAPKVMPIPAPRASADVSDCARAT